MKYAVKVNVSPEMREIICDTCNKTIKDDQPFYATIHENKNDFYIDTFICEECRKNYFKDLPGKSYENIPEKIKKEIIKIATTPIETQVVSIPEEMTLEEYEEFFQENYQLLLGSTVFLSLIKIKNGDAEILLTDLIEKGIISPPAVSVYMAYTTGKVPAGLEKNLPFKASEVIAWAAIDKKGVEVQIKENKKMVKRLFKTILKDPKVAGKFSAVFVDKNIEAAFLRPELKGYGMDKNSFFKSALEKIK